MLRQVFHPLEHLKDEKNLVVAIVFECMGCQVLLVLRELGNDFTEARLHDTRKSVVVTRNDSCRAFALVEKSDLSKVVSLVQVIALLDLSIVISHFNPTMPRSYVIHAKFILVVFILPDHILVWNVQRCLQVDYNDIK